MTDAMIDEQVTHPRPPARPRSRTRPAQDIGTLVAQAVAEAVAPLHAELEELRTTGGPNPFVESAPDPAPPVREADPEELTSFQRELRAQTAEPGETTYSNYARPAKNYNYPLKWFAKHDGSIVQLQGDPQNTSYYRAKGFHELTGAQVERYLKVERVQILRIQQEKAQLIEALREQISRDPNLRASISIATERAWDNMTVAELETFMAEVLGLPDPSGKPRRKLRAPQRLIDAENKKAQAESDRMVAGIETAENQSMEGLQRMLERNKQEGLSVGQGHGRLQELTADTRR